MVNLAETRKTQKQIRAGIIVTVGLMIPVLSITIRGDRLDKEQYKQKVQQAYEQGFIDATQKTFECRGLRSILANNFKPYKKCIDPDKLALIVLEKSAKYGLDPFIVQAIIRRESSCNARATSKYGAMGLMQVVWEPSDRSWPGWQHVLRKNGIATNKNQLFDQATNVEAGCFILARYIDRFGYKEAFARYSGNMDGYLADVLELSY